FGSPLREPGILQISLRQGRRVHAEAGESGRTNMKPVTIERNTRETQIALTLDISRPNEKPEIATGLPFVDHMLTAMSYHGGFTLAVQATGDIEVDPHHLVEDLGIVLGMAIHKAFDGASGLQRYGSSSI